MSDITDEASSREQDLRDDAIAAARRKAVAQALPAVGVCHNCSASVPPGALHCDDDCRRDHVKRRAAEGRVGR